MSTDFGVGSAEDRGVHEEPDPGDRHALAHVYDAYGEHLFDYCMGVLRNPAAAANAVQDTLIAADTQINKLRDYEQLRVWLYAIAHRQCMSELARRSGLATPDEFSAVYPSTPPSAADVDSDESDPETLLVVTAALDGLSDRDREVLYLVFRHGIEGEELATTIGVSAVRARALVSGASTRFEKSAAVVVMLSRGWARCETLESIVGYWDPASPQLTPQLLERLTQHIGSCDTCGHSRGYTVFGPDLLGTVPLAIPPATLRRQITNTALDPEADAYRGFVARRLGNLDKDGFPVQPQARRGRVLAIVASSVALIVLILGGALLYKYTFASTASANTTAGDVAAGSGSSTSASSSPSSSGHSRSNHVHRNLTAPLPGLFGPSPGPAGIPPITTTPTPTPPASPTPRPTKHSKSPKPSPSPTRHSKSPTPTPTPTTPTPTPTTPTPTPTTPTPTPTTPTPTPTTPAP